MASAAAVLAANLLVVLALFEAAAWLADPLGVHTALNEHVPLPSHMRYQAAFFNALPSLAIAVGVMQESVMATAAGVPYLALFTAMQLRFWWLPYVFDMVPASMKAEHVAQLADQVSQWGRVDAISVSRQSLPRRLSFSFISIPVYVCPDHGTELPPVLPATPLRVLSLFYNSTHTPLCFSPFQPRILPRLRADGLVPDIEHTLLFPLTLATLTATVLAHLAAPSSPRPQRERVVILVMGMLLAPLPLAAAMPSWRDDGGAATACVTVLAICTAVAIARETVIDAREAHKAE